MAISVINNVWTVNEVLDNDSGLNKTLATAGKFLDRNIKISVVPQSGSVTLTNNSDVTQTINLNKTTNQYEIKAKSTVTVTPIVTSGWVNSVDDKVIETENIITLNKTTLEYGLTPDGSIYRVSATEGYNEEKLSKDIDVFQGEITI